MSQSLRGQDSEDRLYRLVHEFRRRHYSAHRMTLAVKAPLRLDVLESRVAQYFSQVSAGAATPCPRPSPPAADAPAFAEAFAHPATGRRYRCPATSCPRWTWAACPRRLTPRSSGGCTPSSP